MVGLCMPPQRVPPEEAYRLFGFATTEIYERVMELNSYYESKSRPSDDEFFAHYSLLAFVYGAGRMQGIREERAKRNST